MDNYWGNSFLFSTYNNSKQWKRNPLELRGRKIGVIGMGTTGKLLSDRLLAFGSKVFYYSRSLKPEIEKKGI